MEKVITRKRNISLRPSRILNQHAQLKTHYGLAQWNY